MSSLPSLPCLPATPCAVVVVVVVVAITVTAPALCITYRAAPIGIWTPCMKKASYSCPLGPTLQITAADADADAVLLPAPPTSDSLKSEAARGFALL
jgi:hypothetical protein